MTIYQNAFKNARLFLGISLRKLAAKLKVDAAHISRIENNLKPPGIALLKKLEVVTGLSFWALVNGDFESNNQHLYIKLSNLNLNDMIIDFKELSTEDRKYLRNKFDVDIEELNSSLKNTQDKLKARLEKSNLKEGELEVLETALKEAQDNLDFLKTAGADAAMIASQQKLVDSAETDLRSKQRSSGILTDREIVLEQLEIEETKARIQLRQDQITAIDAAG